VISPSDRIVLPRDVRLTSDGLHDPVRGATFPLNASARLVVGAGTVAGAAGALRARFGVDALADTHAFVAQLNARLLLEVVPLRPRARLAWRWLRGLPVMLPTGALPVFPSRRRFVATSAYSSIVVTGVRAVGPVATAYGALAAVATTLTLHALAWVTPCAAAAVAGGVVAHELGHLLQLRGVPACVAVRGLRVSVLHARGARTRRVAAGGPLAGTALAAVAFAAFFVAPSPELAAIAALESLQLVGFTVLTSDGRRLCARS